LLHFHTLSWRYVRNPNTKLYTRTLIWVSENEQRPNFRVSNAGGRKKNQEKLCVTQVGSCPGPQKMKLTGGKIFNWELKSHSAVMYNAAIEYSITRLIMTRKEQEYILEMM
jgi:hypothetical protein